MVRLEDGPSPYFGGQELTMGHGYEPLTKWDDPPSSQPVRTMKIQKFGNISFPTIYVSLESLKAGHWLSQSLKRTAKST